MPVVEQQLLVGLERVLLVVAVGVVVRLVLSSITRPSKPAREAADEVAWMLGLAIAGREASGSAVAAPGSGA